MIKFVKNIISLIGAENKEAMNQYKENQYIFQDFYLLQQNGYLN